MRIWTMVAVASVIAGASGAQAQGTTTPAPEPRPAPEQAPDPDTGPGQHSINISPIGAVFGNYSLNYEYLLAGYHGFLAEGAYSSSSDDESSATSFGLGAGYRLHWSGAQDSGFFGLHAFYGVGSAEATVSGETFELDVTTVYVAPNIGSRYAWDIGFNITWRLGIGWARYTVDTNRDEPEAREAEDLVNDLLEFIPVAIDAELSIGYIF